MVKRFVVEQAAAHACINRTGRAAGGYADAARGGLTVATEHKDSSAADLLLFANDMRHPLPPVIGERFGRMLQLVRTGRRLTRRHRRGQIDEPAWIECEATHHFERRGCAVGLDD